MNTEVRAGRAIPAFDSRADLPIAVVVGAGGMSMAIAQRLGQSHRIALVSLHPDELQAGQTQLHALGVVSTPFECDITNAASVQSLGEALGKLGPIQAVAHVAALSPAAGNSRLILAVNLIGAALIEQTLRPLMAAGGAAVFISSLSAHAPEPEATLLAILDAPLSVNLFTDLDAAIPELKPGLAYGLSKTALNRMVRRQAFAWGQRGARIVSVSPGLIDTEMGAIEDNNSSKQSKAAMRGRLPLRRDGSMVDIADAVEFLVSRRASYISGTDLLVDGGLAAALRFPES
jgi:NAD(P)-dependent dehydrogenase (short-subunit alcohol dehydrogenase family)